MTIADKTARSQTETVSFELELNHGPQKVWRALTDPVLLADWLLPAIGLDELAPGTSFRFQAQPMPGWDGVVNCRVLEVEEHRMLRYAWLVGDMDTIVTFRLEPSDTGTRLSLEQTGFKDHQKQNFGGARYGWRMMSGKLVEVLATLP